MATDTASVADAGARRADPQVSDEVIKTTLKDLALRLLPDNVLQRLKKIHYARVLAGPIEGEPDLAVLPYLIHAGDTVLDVGANIGIYTRELSRLVGASGQVISLEPIPLTCELLQSTVKKLGWSNVRVINSAASDHACELQMEVPLYSTASGEDFYSARVVAGATDAHMRRFKVSAIVLDSLCDRPVSFVKCDVEGHELHVLAGSCGLIRQHRPAWLIEVSREEVFPLMESYGYRGYRFDGNTLRPRVAGDESINYFFLQGEQLQAARDRGLSVL